MSRYGVLTWGYSGTPFFYLLSSIKNAHSSKIFVKRSTLVVAFVRFPYLCGAFRIVGNAEVRPMNVKGNARQMRGHGENLGRASRLS